jgi:hypothetical protein
LEDWVALLLKARGKIESLEVYDVSRTNADNAVSTTVGTRSVPLTLLKDLFVLSKNNDALKILSNVVTAALHLACMLKGNDNVDGRLVIVSLVDDHWHILNHSF